MRDNPCPLCDSNQAPSEYQTQSLSLCLYMYYVVSTVAIGAFWLETCCHLTERYGWKSSNYVLYSEWLNFKFRFKHLSSCKKGDVPPSFHTLSNSPIIRRHTDRDPDRYVNFTFNQDLITNHLAPRLYSRSRTLFWRVKNRKIAHLVPWLMSYWLNQWEKVVPFVAEASDFATPESAQT
jgi:hypothetical protein